MGRIILLLTILVITTLASCNSSKKQETSSLLEIKPSSTSRHNGSFRGEILDTQNRKDSTKITLSSDTNSYTFDSDTMQLSGTFSWVNETGNIIELKGLANDYPNKFLVTPGAIIQMLDGSTLQDVEGKNQFVLALQ